MFSGKYLLTLNSIFMLQRQVYRIAKAGSIEDLTLQKEPLEKPGPDEVTVKVRAVGLNFADIFAIQGLYSATPKGSFIPGLEFSGEIIALGEQVKDLQVGDKVMGVTKFGGYASHLNIKHRYAIPLPADWSLEEGAGFLVQALTAYYALTKLGNLQKGMTVLIHSAAGGVGIMANRICKKIGAYTIGTVGSKEKIGFLKEYEDYDDIILRKGNFYKKLKKSLQNHPLNLIMECIGGKILEQGWKALAPMGRMVVYGSASFAGHGSKPNYPKLIYKYLKRPKIDPLKLPSENKSLMGFNLIYLYDQVDLLHEMLGELKGLNLSPQHIGEIYSFGEMQEAIRNFQQGKTVGKVIVRLESGEA
jgi:NADPH:quinone reductase-like Zn-dependent oxidoreductase